MRLCHCYCLERIFLCSLFTNLIILFDFLVSTPCIPNPCLHGGICKEESAKTFICDCSGTSYAGKSCQIGLILMPSIPQLILGQPSEEMTIYAKPDEILEIRPKYDKNNLKFAPEKIILYPSTAEATFQITALNIGAFKVNFELVGLNAAVFEKPKQITVYGYKKLDAQPVDIDTNFLQSNCKEDILSQCGAKIKLTSSCIWNKGTNGFVGVKSEKVNIPLSLTGLSEKTKNTYSTTSFLNPSGELKHFLAQSNISTLCDHLCINSNYSNDAINFIMKNNIFQRAYVHEINRILPSWLRINIDSKERYFDATNFLTFLGKSDYIKKIGTCHPYYTSASDFHSLYLPKSVLHFFVGSILKSTEDIGKPTCFAFNLCNNILSVSLQKSNFLNYAEEMAIMGINNIKLTVKGFVFGMKENLCTNFEKQKSCVDVNAYADVFLTSTFNSKRTSLSIDGKLYANLDQQVTVNFCLTYLRPR